MNHAPAGGIRNVLTGSLFEHPEEWQQRLLHRYYEAMSVSLEIWMRQHGWPNPDDSSKIVGDWFDREVDGSDDQTDGENAGRPVDATRRDSGTSKSTGYRRCRRARFATLKKFRERLERDEAERREARQLQAEYDRMSGEGGPGGPCSVPALLGDAPSRRRRFRDYLFRTLVNFARDARRREDREAGLLDEDVAEKGDEPEAEIPFAVALGWDVSQSFDAFAEVLKNFKGLAAAVKRRGKSGELPSWWTLMEITVLRPLLAGCPAAPYGTIARQYKYDEREHGKAVRNAVAAMWRHIRSCSIKLASGSAAELEFDLAEFISNVGDLPRRVLRLSPEERRSVQETLDGALQANGQELQALLDEPMAAPMRRFDLAQAVECLSTIATDFTDEDRHDAWTEVLAMSAESLGGTQAIGLADLLTSADHVSLDAVKETAKGRMQWVDSDVPAEVWRILYYATIAAVEGQQLPRITKLLDEELRHAWLSSSELPWLDDSTRRLFCEAAKKLGSVSNASEQQD